MSVTASRRTSLAVLAISMAGVPPETEPLGKGKDLGDVAPMESRELGVSERIRVPEMRPGRAVGLATPINFPDTTGRLPEWEGPSRKTLLSAED